MPDSITRSLANERSYLHALYQASRDIDRNKSDSDFCRSGGEIVYFLDSNVVIGFVAPYITQSSLKGSFGDLAKWSGITHSSSIITDRTTRFNESRDVRAILLMLSAEHIFSENLIGNKRGLYLTPWHRQEIANVLLGIHAECMHRLKRAGGKPRFMLDTIRRLMEVEKIASLEKKQEYLDFADRIAFDDMLIPLQLIDRILSGDFFRSDAETWDLSQIVTNPENAPWKNVINYHAKSGKYKLNESIDTDSLSLMQWTADNAIGENKRLAFITKDNDISDWYDHWFHEGHTDSGYRPTHYILRRISQYFPQFIPRNSEIGSGIEKNDDEESNGYRIVFEKIRQTIELAIAPDVIRLIGKKYESLTAADFRAYENTNRIDDSIRNKIYVIIDGLADIEQNSTLLFSHYLTKRMPDELLRATSSLNDEDALKKIEHYLYEKSSPNNAIEYFAKKMSGIDPSIWRRIPQTLYFPVGNGGKLFEFIQTSVDNQKIDGDSIKSLSPATVFAVCAGIVYSMENEYASLRLAKRYAELCLESCLSDMQEGNDAPINEANFLCAQINRFLLGYSIDIKTASKHYRKALSLLREIDSGLETDPSDRTRFDAEHAATLMFMAAHHFIAHDLSVQSDLTATPEASHNASAEACLGEARALLESCREKQGLYGTDPDPDSEIKRHYTHNLAAIHVLESLRATSYDAVCIDLDLIASIKSILEKLIDPSDFLRAELYYFLSLCDKSYLVEASRFTESFLLGKSRKLVVDHWQAQVMQKKLAAERSN